MNNNDIAVSRLYNQQLADSNCARVKDVVKNMCALQAQDYLMSKLAIGARLPGSTDQMIEDAIDSGEIIRTHLLRPTWHIVHANDVRWLLELTAPRIKASMKSRHRELELTEPFIRKTNKLIMRVLAGGSHLTREEIISILHKNKINTDDNRASHILMIAELDGIICSGKSNGKKRNYALLEERIPQIGKLDRTAALAELAKRYFTTRGPATLLDFIWWSGLKVTEAKHALEFAKNNFTSATIDSKTFWFIDSFSNPAKSKSIFLLPAYDEFIISYKDMSAFLPLEVNRKVVSSNGLFRPTIVINGQVSGIWKMRTEKDKKIIEARLFESPDKKIKEFIMEEAEKLGQFYDYKTEIAFI